MAIELYPHNQQTYARMIEKFETSNRVGIVQPTGTGKSFLYLKWIEDHPNDTFVVLSPSTEIFTQLQEYAESSGEPDLLKSVETISYQALLRMTDEEVLAIHPDKMVLDEFHRTGAELWGPSLQRLLDANPHTQVLGASATPVRYLDDSKDMASEIFDRNLAVEMTLGEAVERKILSTPTYVPVWYDIDGKMNRYKQDVALMDDGQKRGELEEKLEQLKRRLEDSYGADQIFRKYMPHDHGKYIVFCRSKEHLVEMQGAMRNWLSGLNPNVRCYVSISAQEDKDFQLQEFKDDHAEDTIKLLFTIDRLNEGLHVKGIDGVIMLRPTTSPIIYLQQMGRALSVGCEKPLIFDMVNNYQSVQIPMKDGSSLNVFEKEFRAAMEQYCNLETFLIFEDMAEFTTLFSDLEDVLYPSNESIWEERLSLYKAFKSEFGRDPNDKEFYQGIRIGRWVVKQRVAFKEGVLDGYRLHKLLSIGFDFAPIDTLWEEKFNLYKAFRSEFGRDPKKEEFYQGINLDTWVKSQRVHFKNGKINGDKLQKLLSIGFDFDPIETKWQRNFDLYKAFKAEFGRDPKQNEYYRGVNLGNWVTAQRTYYNRGVMSEDRVQTLLSLGFDFNPIDNTWEKNFNLYLAFKAEFGRDPKRNECYQMAKLGSWINTQRVDYFRGKIRDDRLQKLLSIGFDFAPIDTLWEEKFNLYKAFRSEFGRDPKQEELYQGVSLGSWVNTQRRAYKTGSLSEVQMNELLSIGFDFAPNDTIWEEKFNLYKAFRSEFGRDPKKEEFYQGVNIGSWISNMRCSYNEGTLSENQKLKLLSVGFVTNIKEVQWEKYFKLYKAFKSEFSREPSTSESYNGVNLGYWVNNQRRAYKTGSLSEDRKQRLLECGFILNPTEAGWQSNLDRYKAFRAEFGRDPKKEEFYQGVQLGSWVNRQRKAYRKGSLSDKQIKMLQIAGFDFKAQSLDV